MKYPAIYPAMTVEKNGREFSNHGVKPPSIVGSPEFQEQMQDSIRLCTGVSRGSWNPDVLRILDKYNPTDVPVQDIRSLMADFGHHSWGSICHFVKYDECIEFYPKLIKYAKKVGLKINDGIEGDFSDDSISIYKRYLKELERTTKKAFDVKYFYESERLLVTLFKQTGVDFSSMAGYVHPGHFRYIAQHANKFFTGVEMIKKEYTSSPHFDELFECIAWVESMGRTGILVHLIEDNYNGRHISNAA